METQVITVDPQQIDFTVLKPAIDLIKRGEIVAFPTETVYGLGANAFNSSAVEKIFQAKQRPADNPLIVHISSYSMLHKIVLTVSKEVQKLCAKFWPGPLTLLFEKSEIIPPIVTANLSTVAVRMSSHPIALALIERSGVPIAAPSANASGRPSPTTAQHVLHDLQGRIPMIIDGGQSQIGVESTVIDLSQDPPLILRPGGLNLEDLQKILPTIELYSKNHSTQDIEEKPPTPGLKYRHYAPTGKVILFEGNPLNIHKSIENYILNLQDSTIKVGIIQTYLDLTYSTHLITQKSIFLVNIGKLEHPAEIAHNLFKTLRDMDERNIDIILIEGILEDYEGLAIMNRVRKAATKIYKIS
jgi:L-threonylcarbamoyladenylate synthase